MQPSGKRSVHLPLGALLPVGQHNCACQQISINPSCYLQDELLDVLYWFKQFLAVVLGLIWGTGQVTGLLGFVS